MKGQLENIIKRFQDSQTSLESYRAISDFVEIIIDIPEFIEQVEREGKEIYNAKVDLSNNKKDYSNEYRNRQNEILHRLDPIFPLKNLQDVQRGLKPENFIRSSCSLFHKFNPDEPMLEEDKNEYLFYKLTL